MKYLVGLPILLIISTVYSQGWHTPPDHKIGQSLHPYSQIDSLMILQQQDSLLESFYRQNDFRVFWNSRDARSAVINAVSTAYADGLDPQDYWLPSLQQSEMQFDMMTNQQHDAYDMLLTQSVQKYVSHIAYGKLDPNQLYDDWILPRLEIDINDLILKNAGSANFPTIIDSLKPQHEVYQSLKRALIAIDAIPHQMVDSIRITKKIVANERRDVVLLIKRRLRQWNDYVPRDSITSIYDKATVAAVKNFQCRHGLQEDGIIGPATADALNVSPESRRKSIIANLERWRWYPRDLSSHYIIVNIPAFQLAIIKDNDTIDVKKVIVGTAERRTPVLTSAFNNITFNPTWTVPPTILREDIVPSATKNRQYFYEKRITIYDGQNKVVSPWQWNPDKATTYRYVQSPGTHNALGTVKFNFPNDKMVYLHDTNTRSLFSLHYRALSSGCVRVEDPMPLAQYLLHDDWTSSKLDNIIRSRKPTTIIINDNVRLHQLYWTAWTDADTLIFREDIYNLDQEVFAKLRS